MSLFSSRSKKRLEQCDPKLQFIANELIKIMDVSVLCGFRGEEEQNEAYNNKRSKLKFPQSKHNKRPSLAIDFAPYPIDWENINKFERMCGIIEGIAHANNIKIRLGRDFSFKDYPHIELI